MAQKIILSAAETIVCPKCSHHFALDQGITRQTIERYVAEYEHAMAEDRKALEEFMTKTAERKATKMFEDQMSRLREQLAETQKAEREARDMSVRAQAEAKARAIADFEAEKKSLATELAEKEERLKAFREQELELRREKKNLQEQQANLQLELERKVDEERKRIVEQISRQESERFSLMEAEFRKKIEDAQRANDDLRRKLEQGSQQLQGEVLELELEHTLASAFVHDRIEEVKKGQRGADVLQTVRNSTGQACGKIIWEAKRAENWSEKWLQKLKDDQQAAGADIAVLVTTAMPKNVTDNFAQIGGVWVIAPHLMRPVAETLRVTLIELERMKLVNTGRGEKMEQLYNYLASTAFAQRVRSMLESFEAMRADLEAEKRYAQKMWAKRQGQIERVTTSMVTVVGELQAIAQDRLPQLEDITELEVPLALE